MRERWKPHIVSPDTSGSFRDFMAVVRGRRSVRAFESDPIPDDILNECLDTALLAPTSHNLECWQFIEVRDPGTLARLRHLCLDQPPAVQAPTLIVAVARFDFWRMGRELMLKRLAADAASDAVDPSYRAWLPLLEKKYRYYIPMLFADGPFHILAPLKALLIAAIALFRPMMRGPFGRSEQTIWAVKTAALACENLMLALRAAGYDSCALEGFDEPKVKRLLGLPRSSRIVMVIAAGRRAKDGTMPQVRFDRSLYVKRV
jgi:nitroreductase